MGSPQPGSHFSLYLYIFCRSNDGYKYSRSAALFIIFKRFFLFLLNMGLIEFTGMESEKEINDDEVKNVIDVMAANGKYWYAFYSAVECYFVLVG